MVAVWLIAGDRFERAVSFFLYKSHEGIQFSQLKSGYIFHKWLKYEQMFMGLSMKFGEQQNETLPL